MAYQKFKDRQKSPSQRFLFILGVVMLALYLFLGLTVIFWDKFPWFYGVSNLWKIAFGLLLIVYSFFRFIRLMNQQND